MGQRGQRIGRHSFLYGVKVSSFACPACRRALDGVDACPRCGADVADVHTVHKTSERLLSQGRRALTRRDFLEALHCFKVAGRLVSSDAARKGEAVCLVCLSMCERAIPILHKDV